MAVTQLTGRQIKDQSIDLTVDVTGVLPPANGGAYQYILLQCQKSSGTNGGSATTVNSWFTRELNTIVNDDTGNVVVSSNSFTLPAGTYEIEAGYERNKISSDMSARIRLYNVTDSTMVICGRSIYLLGEYIQSGQSPHKIGSSRDLTLKGKFSIASSKTFRIEMIQSDSSTDTWALGYASSITSVPEIYGEVELRKVA